MGSSIVAPYDNLTVSGNFDGAYFVPGSITQDQPLQVWIETLRRPLTFTFMDEIEVKGIPVWRYQVADEVFQTEIENPDNARFSQTLEGFINITAIKTLPTFVSHPLFRGVDPSVTATLGDGVTSLSSDDNNAYFAVNQLSGISMFKDFRAQITVGYPALTRFYNVTKSGYAPIMWQDDYEVISDDDANKFNNGLKTAQGYAVIAYVLGGGLGIILIAVGVFIVVRAHKMDSGDSKDVELQTREKGKKKVSDTTDEEEGSSEGTSEGSSEGTSATSEGETETSEGTSGTSEGTATSSQDD